MTQRSFYLERLKNLSSRMEKAAMLQAISKAFLALVPITIGSALFSILLGIPVESWQNWLKSTGLYDSMFTVINAASNMPAPFLAFVLSYFYCREKQADGLAAGLISLASFLALIPLSPFLAEGASVTAADTVYFSSTGFPVAMVTGMLTGFIYLKLNTFHKGRSRSSTLPPSMADLFFDAAAAFVMLSISFLTRFLFSLTFIKTVFGFCNLIVSPIMKLGASPVTVILVAVLADLIWFFGIHPSLINKPFQTVIKIASAANIAAFMAGDALPYLPMTVVGTCVVIGGTGGTLGLSLDALLFSRSQKYRQLGHATILTSLCNINEPVIFGFPVAYHLPYLLPMLAGPILCGLAAWAFCALGLIGWYNPVVSLPWAVPYVISAVFKGGVSYLLLTLLCVGIQMLLWFPAFHTEDLKQQAAEKQGWRTGSSSGNRA